MAKYEGFWGKGNPNPLWTGKDLGKNLEGN